jgi:5,10-methylene-tetrahydrofolate dehydrogenase/methenyl tetrahydrofolate cyclohydrolase
MPHFIVNSNSQPTGEHEVHNLNADCRHLPLHSNQVSLGDHLTCSSALNAVRRANPAKAFDGCMYCAPACHTR